MNNWRGLKAICLIDDNLSNTYQKLNISHVEFPRGPFWDVFLVTIKINDIESALKRSEVILYADDTVIFSRKIL